MGKVAVAKSYLLYSRGGRFYSYPEPIGYPNGALPPTAPLIFTSPYQAQGGSTIVVNSGGDLQAALNSAQLGDKIVLEAGATWVGNYTLPAKSGSGWVYVESSALGSLPAEGTRATLANVAAMPTIIAVGSAPAIDSVNSSNHYRFIGINFEASTTSFMYALVQIGGHWFGAPIEDTLGKLSTYINFDRCVFQADPGFACIRGLAMNGSYLSVETCSFYGFQSPSADSQAIAGWSGPGPYRIINSYLEGAGENVIFGGNDSAGAAFDPADIEIRDCHMFKPLAWKGTSIVVKNLFELKNARRVLVVNNLMENHWANQGQSGASVLFTVRNQDGDNPTAVIEDVEFRGNRVVNSSGGFNIYASDNINPSDNMKRLYIHDNIVNVNGKDLNDNYGLTQRAVQIGQGDTNKSSLDLVLDHNTFIIESLATSNSMYLGAGTAKHSRTNIRNNLFEAVTSGVGADSQVEGNAALNSALEAGYSFEGNALVGRNSAVHPVGNYFPVDRAAVGFTGYAAEGKGDYTLTGGSPLKDAGTDGKDVGADNAVVRAYP